MKSSIEAKLAGLVERHEEIGVLLSQPDIIQNQNKFRDLSREYSDLQELVTVFTAFQQLNQRKQTAELLLTENDPELKSMAAEEIAEIEAELPEIEAQLQFLLLPKDPDDDKSIFLEIRAAAGGDEAAIFAGDLFKMYSRYADLKKMARRNRA